VFGSAKATQEADLVLILQRLEGHAYLDVKKNRYDGAVGRIYLGKTDTTFFELYPERADTTSPGRVSLLASHSLLL
jgi:hypothetical protein